MAKKGKKKEKMIDVLEGWAIIKIPVYAMELEMSAKYYHDGKMRSISKALTREEIRDAFEEYRLAEEMGYIPPDATFHITEEGIKYLEELRSREECHDES